jgi:porin
MARITSPRFADICASGLVLFLAASTLLIAGVSAADFSLKETQDRDRYYSANDFWTRKYMLGDLGRARLEQEGVSFSGEIKNESVANGSGGERKGGANAGQLTFGAKFDADKLAGLPGGLIGITLVDRWGRNLNADAGIPALQLTDEAFGRDKIVRLVEFYYDQKLFNGMLEVKGGRLPVGADFFYENCDFLNLTFCGGQPGNILGGYIYNFPVSQMGGVAKMNLPSSFQFEVGIYDSNTNYLGTKPDVALLPTFAPSAPNSGVLVPVELNWRGSFNGLASVWKIGGWYDSQKAEQAVAAAGVAGVTPNFQRGEYGGYVSIFQQLVSPGSFKDAQDREHGVFTFFNLTVGDHRTSVLDYQVAWGLQKVGTFASRPEDQIGFAAGTTHVNSSIASAEAAAIPIRGVQHNEYPLEAWYGWQATPWLNLKLDLQYVINPGGFDARNSLEGAHGNAIVVGLRTVLKL